MVCRSLEDLIEIFSSTGSTARTHHVRLWKSVMTVQAKGSPRLPLCAWSLTSLTSMAAARSMWYFHLPCSALWGRGSHVVQGPLPWLVRTLFLQTLNEPPLAATVFIAFLILVIKNVLTREAHYHFTFWHNWHTPIHNSTTWKVFFVCVCVLVGMGTIMLVLGYREALLRPSKINNYFRCIFVQALINL